MRKPELSGVYVATYQRFASDLRTFTLLPSALCRLHSQADIATIFLDQDDVRQGFFCGSLRLFSKSTKFVFRLSSTLDYVAAARHINPKFVRRALVRNT
jgi:hypothetical protein